ncbi:hypothetical protein E2C01_082463 [Portunus trituberculatus]|uniref:Uncharacterized protein n=1 Tax=Portunus trituberculatus TaxID=210409 RepID=A0A5B7J1R5_PORTR|nr:hypothetical protein [Portunus trituberculatus]
MCVTRWKSLEGASAAWEEGH